MKTLKVLAVFVLLSATVLAQSTAWKDKPTQNQHQNQHQEQTVNSGNTTSNSHNNTNTNTAQGGTGGAGGEGGAGGNATGGTGGNSSSASNAAGGNASNGPQSNAQSTTENTNIPRETPPAYAPPVFPTDPCQKGASAGGSSPFFGLSLGWSRDSKECEKVVGAASFVAMNNYQAAAKILCTLKVAQAAKLTIDDCMAFVIRQEPKPQVSTPTPQIIVPAPQITINNPPIQLPMPLTTVAPPSQCKKSTVHKNKAKPCPTLEK